MTGTGEAMDENVNRDKGLQEKYDVVLVAPLGNLGIGNPDGIPSRYAGLSTEQIKEKTEEFKEHLITPNDLSCTACIDGRCTLQNADGSEKQVRLRRVGGSASNLGVALNAGSDIIKPIDRDSTIGHYIKQVDKTVKEIAGFEPSAHLGGCGGANGEVDDNWEIAKNDAIMGTVETFMNIPEVREYLGVDYDSTLGDEVRANAAKTATFLESKGWDGKKYVEGVVKYDPSKVEDLQVADDKYHGHKEDSLVVVIGDETLDLDDHFVWNLKASKMVAESLAGGRGVEGYTQAIIAEIAKHIAVANRLPSDGTPITILRQKDVALAA